MDLNAENETVDRAVEACLNEFHRAILEFGLENEDLFWRIRLADRAAKQIERRVHTFVEEARAEDMPWRRVADAVRLEHRGSAEKRYGKGRERQRERQRRRRSQGSA